jgi:hypothetical protein
MSIFTLKNQIRECVFFSTVSESENRVLENLSFLKLLLRPHYEKELFIE